MTTPTPAGTPFTRFAVIGASLLTASCLAAPAATDAGAAEQTADATAEPLARWAFLLFILVALGVGVVTVLAAMWRLRVARHRGPAGRSAGARADGVDPWFESGRRTQTPPEGAVGPSPDDE